MRRHGSESVLVACPDARPPAYQAVAGLARSGLLQTFLTGFYDLGLGIPGRVARGFAPAAMARVERRLNRRFDPAIPPDRVRAVWSYDLALQVESRLAGRRPSARRALAQWRTLRFDRILASRVRRDRPAAALVFSDVGSRFTLPVCENLGIPYVLSMVHGDVREEREVLEREAEASPDFFPMYLGDNRLDRDELDWLHARRLYELGAADLVLVPSDHIAATLAQFGTHPEKIRVIPYAADTLRFRPDANQPPAGRGCTFLFAGGVSQRKGIKYLLEAWRRVRRPGWRLQLLGALPRDPGPLASYLDGVEVLGRVPHSEVPARMAAADVFVFPSLFEGSAVVTYEALACGLPCVVTPSAGSVVRDGVEGLLVPPGDANALADAMERLGNDPVRRTAMGRAARTRAESFDWPRYHEAVAAALNFVLHPRSVGVRAGRAGVVA